MAYQILYDILNEIEGCGEEERIQAVTNLLNKDDPHSWQSKMNVLDWVEEQLDLLNIPEGMFRQGYVDGLKPRHGDKDKDGELYHLIEHIWAMIPEEEQKEIVTASFEELQEMCKYIQKNPDCLKVADIPEEDKETMLKAMADIRKMVGK